MSLLLAIKDPGVKADVDRFRGLEEEHQELLQREQSLHVARSDWRSKSAEVKGRLISSQARTRVWPYLRGQANFPSPRTRTEELASGGIPIAEALGGLSYDGSIHPLYFPHPFLHEDARTRILHWAESSVTSSSSFPSLPIIHPTPTPYPIAASRIKCNKCQLP